MDQDLAVSFFVPFLIAAFAVWVVLIVATWKVFTKAGRPGWASIIPIYNVVVLLQIAGKPGWWIILCLVPLVNIVIVFIAYISLAKTFGKGAGFGVGLVLLCFVFFPILAFGDARYLGPSPGAPAQA